MAQTETAEDPDSGMTGSVWAVPAGKLRLIVSQVVGLGAG